MTFRRSLGETRLTSYAVEEVEMPDGGDIPTIGIRVPQQDLVAE